MRGKSIGVSAVALLLGSGFVGTVAAEHHGHAESPEHMERHMDPERDGEVHRDDARDRPDRMTNDRERDPDRPDDVDEVLVPEPEEENGTDLFAPPAREDDPALLK